MLLAGIHGLFCLGTNGEFYALSRKEKLAVAETVIDQCAGRAPVFVGTGCVGTRETVELSREAERMGADALSIVCPWFAKCSQEELYRHFATVADSVRIPVVLYNIPARTGVNLSVETARRLGQIGNVYGVKDSSGNFDQMLQYIESAGSDFAVYSGNDSLVLWNLQAGGCGGICGLANLFPETMAAIYERWNSGDFAGARQAQDSVRAFRNLFSIGNPNSIVKMAANLLGYAVGKCRAPFWSGDHRIREQIQATLDQYYVNAR